MTAQSKAKQTKKQIESLELNRETLRDLTEQEGEQAEGGVFGISAACGVPPSVYIRCQ